MAYTQFPQEAMETLKHYVYRLIDPRNGETFYVGRGQGQRVFNHVNGAIENPEQSAADPKLERIHDIRARPMDVQHIIHRHGMTESAAKEVEAALIDAYPGLVNRMAGAGADRGARHSDEIIREYIADEFEVGENLIMISIGQLYKNLGPYEAVRGVWKMKLERAENHGNLVLARYRKVIVGAYRPCRWMKGMAKHIPDQIGFDGKEATDVWDKYVGKRVPDQYLKKGAANPCRYLFGPPKPHN